MAEKLARDLADRGLVIDSGLARGIDSCAHKGALSSPTGPTIGVLGCGIDVSYPKENKKIFGEMEKRGAIISEFALAHSPARRTSRSGTASFREWLSAWFSSKALNTPAP